MKKIFKAAVIAVATVVLALCFCACGGNKRESEFISVTFSPYPYTGQTKFTYYSGESFSDTDTCVGLKYYLKEDNTEYTQNFSLGNPPSHVTYEVSGFDSSVPIESQTVTVKFTSSKVPGEITGTFNIKILPPQLTGLELKDTAMIKDTYVVNEQLDYDNIVLCATYGNGTEENVPLTADMVSGFDTSAVSTNNKAMTVTYKDLTKKFYYNVAPAENYEKLDAAFIKCFVPTAESGYSKKSTSSTAIELKKSGVASINLECFKRTNITQTLVEYRFNTSGSIINNNVTVKSFDTKNINENLSATVCKFTIAGGAATYTAVYVDNVLKTSNGTATVTQQITVEILFTDYAKSDETAEMIKNVMGSIVA